MTIALYEAIIARNRVAVKYLLFQGHRLVADDMVASLLSKAAHAPQTRISWIFITFGIWWWRQCGTLNTEKKH